MSKIARVAVLVASTASMIGAVAPTAGAVTWHNTGSTAFTATGGPSTLSRGGVNIACSGSTATGTAPGGSTVGAIYAMSWTTKYAPCTTAGQNTFKHCTWTFTGSTHSSGQTSGTADVTCQVRLTAVPTIVLCHIEGTTPMVYFAPSPPFAGRLTVLASSTLTITDADAACPLGTGTTSFTEHSLVITGGSPTSTGPVLNRTA